MRFQHNQLEAIMKFACEGSSVAFQNGLVFDGQTLIASDGLSIVKVTDPYSEPLGQQFLIPLDPVRLALTATEDQEPIWINAGEVQFANMVIKYETRAGEIPDFKKVLFQKPWVEGYPNKFFTIHPKRLSAAMTVCRTFNLVGNVDISHDPTSEIIFLSSRHRLGHRIEIALMGNQLW